MNLKSFAESRGFRERELSKYGVRVEGDVVVIPIMGRHGVWYEREHRPDGLPKYRSPRGATPHLYNPLGLGPNASEVWIAEGEFDTLALVAVGAPAVGILGKEAFRTEWALLYETARVVVAIDPDAEVRAMMLMNLWKKSERFNTLPHEDANEWFLKDRDGLMLAVLAW